MRARVVAFVFAGVLAAGRLFAAGGTIQDQAVSLQYPATHWSSVAGAHLGGVWASDPLSASGWWYRAGTDPREYPLPAPDLELYTGTQLVAIWNDVDGKGFSAREDTAVFDNERPSGTFTSRLAVTNNSSSAMVIQLFHYLDVDVPGNVEDDVATSLTSTYLRFTDLGGSVIRYRGGSTAPVGSVVSTARFQVAAYPGLRNALNDSAATTLTNAGVPFGPGNATAAYQWHCTLQPGAWAGAYASVSFREAEDYVKADYFHGQHTGFPNLFFQRVSMPDQLLGWHMRRTSRESSWLKLLEPNRRVVGTDDFDGDFTTDLVEHDATTGLTYVDGDLVTGALPAPYHWRISATGDFDRDGHPDIVWRSFLTQKIAIWRMNDTAKIGDIVPVPDQAADANWAIVAARDFNDDGLRDLLWYNSTSGNAVIWHMDAAVKRISGVFTNPMNAGDSNWKIVAAGDYGKGPASTGTPVFGTPDIVWRNATSGRLVVWHMNFAAQRTGGVFVTPDLEAPLDYEVVGPR